MIASELRHLRVCSPYHGSRMASGENDDESMSFYDFVEQEFDYTSVLPIHQKELWCKDVFDQVPDEVKIERTSACLTCRAARFCSHRSSRWRALRGHYRRNWKNPRRARLSFIGHIGFQAPDCDGAVHIAEWESRSRRYCPCDLGRFFLL